jgi:hypothetical protein
VAGRTPAAAIGRWQGPEWRLRLWRGSVRTMLEHTFVMHPPSIRAAALDLVAAGHDDTSIAHRLGVPRRTVNDWRAGRARIRPACPFCARPARPVVLEAADYAELLGLYLGDGHISRTSRTFRLRISLDARYPGIVADTEAILARCFPANRVGELVADGGSTIVVWVYSMHLPCLFPQHGIGKKHERRIELQPWQREKVAAAPWAFLRGCIRSDGCAYVNRTGRYTYLSYNFHNYSSDILDLFERVCRAVGLECRRTVHDVRIYRRSSVARMLDEVGMKR